MPFFMIEFQFSVFITVILMFAVLFFRWAMMVSMAAGDSSHLEVQASFMLVVHSLISSYVSFMPCGCLSYLSWSASVISMMSRSICLPLSGCVLSTLEAACR